MLQQAELSNIPVDWYPSSDNQAREEILLYSFNTAGDKDSNINIYSIQYWEYVWISVFNICEWE